MHAALRSNVKDIDGKRDAAELGLPGHATEALDCTAGTARAANGGGAAARLSAADAALFEEDVDDEDIGDEDIDDEELDALEASLAGKAAVA